MNTDKIDAHQFEMRDVGIDGGFELDARLSDVDEVMVERRVVIHAPQFDLLSVLIRNNFVFHNERRFERKRRRGCPNVRRQQNGRQHNAYTRAHVVAYPTFLIFHFPLLRLFMDFLSFALNYVRFAARCSSVLILGSRRGRNQSRSRADTACPDRFRPPSRGTRPDRDRAK